MSDLDRRLQLQYLFHLLGHGHDVAIIARLELDADCAIAGVMEELLVLAHKVARDYGKVKGWQEYQH